MRFINFFIIIFLLPNFVFASMNLQNERTAVITKYIQLLGQGNYPAIEKLFTEGGMAISSSGKIDKPHHFYKLLFVDTISHPKSKLINIFQGTQNKNMMAAYFNFAWRNEKGRNVAAKFLDLFIFEENSNKISVLLVFSNTFQQDIMKQYELS